MTAPKHVTFFIRFHYQSPFNLKHVNRVGYGNVCILELNRWLHDPVAQCRRNRSGSTVVGRSEGTNNDYTRCKGKKVSSLTKKKTPAVSYFPTSFCGEKLPEGPKDTQWTATSRLLAISIEKKNTGLDVQLRAASRKASFQSLKKMRTNAIKLGFTVNKKRAILIG